MEKVALTGIKPTGSFHLGNYLSAVRSAIALSSKNNYTCYYFIANYHALTAEKNPALLEEQTYHILASWLAFMHDKKNVFIYLQSDISEIFELYWILTCYTHKGLMDRAHSYKDALSKDIKNINIGLYTYPVLMAADILCFDTDYVPVGKDQKQHLEIARDIATTFNTTYKKDIFKIPEPIINESTSLIIGIDGQKMSKSKNNIIPLFVEENKLRKIINKIVTDSKAIEDSKDPNTCNIFSIYKYFASSTEINDLKEKYLSGGMPWSYAKDLLFEVLINNFKKERESYFKLIADKAYLNTVLKTNKEIVKQKASLVLKRVKENLNNLF